MKVKVIPIVIGGLSTTTKGLVHPNYNIAEIGQNTKESPGDLKRLDLTQSPVENHRLILV